MPLRRKRERRNSKSRFGQSGSVNKHPDPRVAADLEAISCRRLWLFRLIAITVIPAALLFAAEISLRIGGYGYSASVLRRTAWKGEVAYCYNWQFGWRFWPPHISRRAEPYIFLAKKPKNTYRIFILGGSAAMGTPESAYGASAVNCC